MIEENRPILSCLHQQACLQHQVPSEQQKLHCPAGQHTGWLHKVDGGNGLQLYQASG